MSQKMFTAAATLVSLAACSPRTQASYQAVTPGQARSMESASVPVDALGSALADLLALDWMGAILGAEGGDSAYDACVSQSKVSRGVYDLNFDACEGAEGTLRVKKTRREVIMVFRNDLKLDGNDLDGAITWQRVGGRTWSVITSDTQGAGPVDFTITPPEGEPEAFVFAGYARMEAGGTSFGEVPAEIALWGVATADSELDNGDFAGEAQLTLVLGGETEEEVSSSSMPEDAIRYALDGDCACPTAGLTGVWAEAGIDTYLVDFDDIYPGGGDQFEPIEVPADGAATADLLVDIDEDTCGGAHATGSVAVEVEITKEDMISAVEDACAEGGWESAQCELIIEFLDRFGDDSYGLSHASSIDEAVDLPCAG